MDNEHRGSDLVSRLLDRPIFVAGRGRSGTSLLDRLFDGHPQVCSLFGESRVFTEIAPSLRKSGDRGAAAAALSLRFPSPRGETDEGVRERIEALDLQSPLLARRLFEIGLERWTRRRKTENAIALFEKTPKNEEHLESLFENFPNAKVIYLLRDPRGVYISNRRSELHRLEPQIVAAQWAKSVRRILAFSLKPDLGARIHVVRFEELVQHPRAALEVMCQVLGLDWSETLSQPTMRGQPWAGNAFDLDKRTPDGVAAHKAHEWQDEITPEEEAAIIAAAMPQMALLGYALSRRRAD